MEREVKPGQKYRHFKGTIATVITIATHTETGEKLVIYKCEGSKESKEYISNHVDGVYARPLEMFLSEVDHEKYPDVKQKYRLELIEDVEGE